MKHRNKKNNILNNLSWITSVFILVALSFQAVSDDTDIIELERATDSNILFVMDMSGSMSLRLESDHLPGPGEKSRKQILNEALRTVLNAPELTALNIRAGIASFAGNPVTPKNFQKAHGITYPVSALDSDAGTILDSNALWNHRTDVYDGDTITSFLPEAGSRTTIGFAGDVVPASWTPWGKTPIVDSMYEAALYFRGETVDYGRDDPSRITASHPSTYTGLIYDHTTWVDNYVSETCSGGSCNSTMSCYTPMLPGACTTSGGTAASGCTTTTSTNTVPAGCNADTWVPGSPGGVCNGYDVEGDCNSWTSATAGYWVTGSCWDEYTTTSSSTSCTTPATGGTTTCEPDYPGSEICSHTVNRPIPHVALKGSGVYNSPINEECPNNAIVLLSDGQPTKNTAATKVKSLIGGKYARGCDNTPGTDRDIPHAGRCGEELSKYLANEDQSSSVTGNQYIKTHTIGLALNASSSLSGARRSRQIQQKTKIAAKSKEYLETLADAGNGISLTVDTPEGLEQAFLETIISTQPRARTFVSPTYTNSSKNISHGDYVYLPVFDIGVGNVWSGNLKKFKRLNGKLVDKSNVAATDAIGTLKDTARDYWSTGSSSDSAVKSGGVANKLPNPNKRKLFTDAGFTSGTLGSINLLKTTNSKITKTLLGNALMSSTYRNDLIEYIRGKNPSGNVRNHIGDIIHSKPIFIDYGSSKRLYVGTNEGYLHSFDEGSGVEKFAFMPEVLLKNINQQYKNDFKEGHPYGVDGPMALDHVDKNHDGIVNGSDTAILYFGLRRGGKAYYALDVTKPDAPKLNWKINSSKSGFSRLGYTWSQPVVMDMKIKKNSPPEKVLVFGGGYYDDNNTTHNGTTGVDVFIVKASDGSLVWNLANGAKTSKTDGIATSKFKHPIPGNIRVMDMTGNNQIDRLYFGDTGGNVWRVDFEGQINGSGAKKAKQKLFANLGPNRQFFTEPDVAIFKADGRYLISVAIGSGSRPDPLDASTDDNFFLMFDKDVRKLPTASTPIITRSKLKNATSGPVTGVLSGSYSGWYMDLEALQGEKILSRATIYNNKVLFNSFGIAPDTSGIACAPELGTEARLYAADLFTGGGVVDLNNNSSVDSSGLSDRSKKIAEGEIPGPPQILIDKPSTCVKGDCVIKESVASGRANTSSFTDPRVLRRVFWVDQDDKE